MWWHRSATTAHRALLVCDWPSMGIPWATASSNAASPLCSRCGGACTGCCSRAGYRWFMGGAVLMNVGVFQIWRRCSTPSAHRPLPLTEWPALGMPWPTASSNAASAVCSRCGGACTGHFDRTSWVVCGRCGFAERWSFQDVEAQLGNHSAQSPASVSVASPGHATGRFELKYSLCSVQQVWWSLHWVLQQGWAGGLWGVRFF